MAERAGLTLYQLAKQASRDVQDLAAYVDHDQLPACYDQMSGEIVLCRQMASRGN
ncbi:hypothetical protein [Leisingera sp. ANG-M7]|uniref:hypothetical protein n=1 Tax=Leisingera sp. ANG-M7 TaxID=1577902 RepID=UPI000A4624FF|nr:hypothetical protein [Leisingera sp. ANG-M7]